MNKNVTIESEGVKNQLTYITDKSTSLSGVSKTQIAQSETSYEEYW